MRPLRAATFGASAVLVLPEGAWAHGDRVPRSELASSWSVGWPVAVLAALGLALFVQGFVRLRRRGRLDHAGLSRALLFGLGTAILVLAVASPLDAVGESYLLSGHMLQHMLIADAAPALLVLAVRGPLAFFLVPPLLLRALARVDPLRSVLSTLLRPRVSFAVWVAVFASWHVPAVYDSVLHHAALHDLEHVTFLVAGLLVWAQLIDPARRRALSRYRRLAFAVALFACGQVLADVLIFTFHPLYPAYAGRADRLFGLSPLLDQQLAGLVMLVEQALTLGTFGAVLLWPSLRRPRRSSLAPELA